MRIDAHQHYWSLERGDYHWLTPDLAAIHRDFLPEDLAPLLARHGIDRTILVQAAPTLAETIYLLKLAAATPSVAGVVGWVDFEAEKAPELIERLATDPLLFDLPHRHQVKPPGAARFDRLLVGLRPMVHDITSDVWLLRDAIAPAVETMIEHDLVFDALVRPQHLRALRGFVDSYPPLRVVIDHGAKPRIAERSEQPWLDDMRALAAHPRVSCKLSGLITEAGPDWLPDEVMPYIARLLELFGPDRLLWGSDWPVVNLAGGYDAWQALTTVALHGLKAAQRDAVLGGNAARIYLGRGRGVA